MRRKSNRIWSATLWQHVFAAWVNAQHVLFPVLQAEESLRYVPKLLNEKQLCKGKKKLKEKCRALNSVVRNPPRIPPKDSNAGRGVEKSLLPRNVFSQDDGFGRESVKRFPLEMRQANHAVTGGDLRFLALICTKK